MPAPVDYSYSVAALVAAHTALRDLIDAGTGAGSIKLYSDADVLLAEIPLTDPCGTVAGGSGQLTLTASASETSAPAGGVCTYGTVCDGDDAVHMTIPAQQGASAVSGKIVLNTTTIVLGAVVSLVSAVVG
jgi:hypothetical protein